MIEPKNEPKREPYDLMIVWCGSVAPIVGKVTVINGVTRHDVIPVGDDKALIYVKDGIASYVSGKHFLYFGAYEKALDKRPGKSDGEKK